MSHDIGNSRTHAGGFGSFVFRVVRVPSLQQEPPTTASAVVGVKVPLAAREGCISVGVSEGPNAHSGGVTVRAPVPAEGLLFRLPGARFFGAFWGSLLAVDVGRLVSAASWAPTLLVAGTVCLCSIGQRALVVAAAGLTGWLVVTGFIVNDDGALVLTGAADIGRLFLLLTCAALGAALPTLTRS